MKPKQRRSRVSALATVGLVSVLACLYDRDPTGLSDARRLNASSQGGIVYAEERRAVELAQAIPDLAGFFFDSSGNVVVLLKAESESPATKGLLRARFARELARGRVRNPVADLIVRTAKYSFLELKEWRDRLMNADILTIEGVVWLDLDEAQNRVVIGLDVDADRAALGDIARDIGVPAEAVEFEVTGPYQPQETLRDEFRPIKGGIQIQRVSGTSAGTCTLGFTAVWQDQDVFLTAGHCSPDPTGADGVEQFQPTAPLTAGDSASITAIGREVAHVSEPCGNRRCSYSDAAIYELIPDTVPPIPSQSWTLGRVAHPAYGCFPGPCDPLLELGSDWVIDTTHESFVVNDLGSKIGSATGWTSGNVTKTCVNVSPAQGVTLYCQMYAGYAQDDGDSGAPILMDIGCCGDSTVTLGGIHSGKAGKNAVFSPWSGIVQDYGTLSVAFVQEDTTRPPIPPTPNLPSDSTFTVEGPGYPRSELLYYRNIVGIIFDDTTRGTTVRAVLARYAATIIGGAPGDKEYIVQIPDPGPTFAALDSVVARLNSEPGVALSSHVYYRTPFRLRSRYPNDGPGARRADWATPTNATRRLLQIRAPLAWGCETGTYAQARVRVGVIDAMFDTLHPDLSGRLAPPPPPELPSRHTPICSRTYYSGRMVRGPLGCSPQRETTTPVSREYCGART